MGSPQIQDFANYTFKQIEVNLVKSTSLHYFNFGFLPVLFFVELFLAVDVVDDFLGLAVTGTASTATGTTAGTATAANSEAL